MWKNAWARLALCAIVAASAVAILTTTASAAPTCTNTWIGGHDTDPTDFRNDWRVAANWNGGVPGVGANVCIESGSPVIYTGTQLPSSIGSLDIGSSGAASLTADIGEVINSGASTIAPDGTLTLNGSYNGGNAGNAALGGGTVDNRGTIVMEGTG